MVTLNVINYTLTWHGWQGFITRDKYLITGQSDIWCAWIWKQLLEEPYRKLLQELLYAGGQGGFRNSTNDSILLLATPENHDRWYASNAILGCNGGALISVDFVAFQLPRILLRQFINYRMNHSAWTTPWSPELHEDRWLRFHNKGLPCSIIHSCYC